MPIINKQANGGFVTGANAILKIDGVAIAVARDLSYSISIPHVPVEVMGVLEVIANEPVAYSVSGSFSIYRYNKKIMATIATELKKGNTIGEYGQVSQVTPGSILYSRTFDLVVQLKDNGVVSVTETQPPQDLDKGHALFNYLVFKNCRIVNRSSGLDKRGVQVERFDFVAIMGGDDGVDLVDSQIVNDGENAG